MAHLSPHFTLSEATKSQEACRKAIFNTPNEDQLKCLRAVAEKILEPVREHFDKPFSPSSWFRCPELCIAIGSNAKSQHARGEAVDFEVPGVPNAELAEWIKDNLDFDQLILEYWSPDDPAAGWVHVSYKEEERRKQVLRFDGDTYQKGLPD